MGLNDRLARLKRLSPASLPRVVARRLASAGRGVVERVLYTAAGPRRPAPRRDLVSLGLLHPSVLRPGFADAFRARFPGEAEAIVAVARQAADGIVDLFGQPVDLRSTSDGGGLPWHTDVFTGFRWTPSTWFGDVRWGAGADIRVPWELSRCAHFVTLGQAYVLTRDEAFARAFSDQLEDWIRRNPPKRGVNWVCAMDVALRAGNWLAAWEFLSASPSISPFVRKELPRSLWEHGHHVAGHLEWAGEVSTNHYLSDLLGLWYIGLALGNASWATFARGELTAGILTQTHADGLDYEASTAYHRLVLEIFFYFALLEPDLSRDAAPSERATALTAALGAPFMDRFREMFRIAGALAAPNGRTPLIGDNDSARVHVFRRRDDADMGYLGDLAAAFLGDDRSRPAGAAAGPETAWLFGVDAAAAVTPRGVASVPNLAPGASGLVTFRGPRDAATFLLPPNGTRGVGNHTHNDKLSVLLSVGADDFLVDAGMPAYTGDPEKRNLFRSTRSHSTVMVDGAEQNRFLAGNLFTLADDARPVLEEFRDGQRVAASHTGYRRLARPVTHRRSLERIAEPLSWIIEDALTGEGDHEALWTFVCGAGIAVTVNNGAARLEGRDGVVEIQPHPATLRFDVEAGEVSPAYHAAQPASYLRAAWKGRLPFRATFTLVWSPKERAR